MKRALIPGIVLLATARLNAQPLPHSQTWKAESSWAAKVQAAIRQLPFDDATFNHGNLAPKLAKATAMYPRKNVPPGMKTANAAYLSWLSEMTQAVHLRDQSKATKNAAQSHHLMRLAKQHFALSHNFGIKAMIAMNDELITTKQKK